MKNHLISTLTIAFIAMVLNTNVAYGQNFYKEKISRDNFLQVGIGLGTLYADNLGSLRLLEAKTICFTLTWRQISIYSVLIIMPLDPE